MRFSYLLALLLTLGLCAGAAAQTPAKPAAAVATPAAAAPASPLAPAIIPGSPLAALTGTAPATPDDAVNAPFGTNTLGFSVTAKLGEKAAGTFGEFVAAMRKSTNLTPIITWLGNFPSSPTRRADATAIGLALLVVLLPALVADAVLRFALRHPAALCVKYAPPRQEEFLPNADEQGLADAAAGATEKPQERRISLLGWARRVTFALLSFALALLPLAGFVVTLQVLIANGLITSHAAHLAVIGIANGYLVLRASLEVLRLLLAPTAPSLRLIAMPSPRAAILMHRALVLLGTGFVGYCMTSSAVILGLSQAGMDVLIRFIALVVYVEIAVCIWQCRFLVGGWIAGSPEASGTLARFRRRLGGIWHYFALFYVLALWTAWTGGVHNAFGVLLRVVLVLLAALVTGRLAWVGSALLLEHALPAATDAQHPVLLTRARAYNPLIRALIRTVIGVLMVLLILQGWGVDAFNWLLNDPLSRSLLNAFVAIIITIAVALVLWEATNIWLNGRIDRLAASGLVRQASRLRTLLPMLRATIGVVIALVAGFICLAKIGVNAAPLFAGAGVVGIAVGFGSQKLVQDVITGLFLLLEDAMQVGDVVALASMTGTVERLSIRTIRLRGGDGSVNIIPFSAVTTVTNMTRDFGYAEISITVGYHENIDHVSAVLTDIARTMRAEAAWGAMMRDDLQLFGVDSFGTLGITITGQIRTGPGQHWSVRREFYARVQKRFAEDGIEIPYTHQSFRLDLPPPPAVEGPEQKSSPV